MTNNRKLIETEFDEFITACFGASGPCCVEHREQFRVMFMTGAVALFDKLVDAEPDRTLRKAIADELASFVIQSGEADPADRVRH